MLNAITNFIKVIGPCLFFNFIFIGLMHAQGSPDAMFSSNNTSGESHATIKVRSNGYTGDTTEIKLTNMTYGGAGAEFILRSVDESGLVVGSNFDLSSNSTDNIMTLDAGGGVTVGSLSGLDVSSVMVDPAGQLSRGQRTYYTHRTGINNNSIDINIVDTWLHVGPPVTLIKRSNFSAIEAELLSRVSYLMDTATGVRFRVQIIGETEDQYTHGVAVDANYVSFVVAKSFLDNIPSGSYTVRVHAQIRHNTATAVILDPGGFGGSILIKERS